MGISKQNNFGHRNKAYKQNFLLFLVVDLDLLSIVTYVLSVIWSFT